MQYSTIWLYHANIIPFLAMFLQFVQLYGALVGRWRFYQDVKVFLLQWFSCLCCFAFC